MKSPFPGMDPYLEARWGDVHTRFMVYAADALTPQLPPNLVAHVEEYMSVVGAEEDDRYASDVRVEETPANGHPGGTTGSGLVAIADPLVVPTALARRTLRSLRIIDPDSGNRVVTAIELLSRANKVGRRGRDDYERKQRDLLDAGASLVEIDLLRSGAHVRAVPYDNFSPDYREPCRVCVNRSWAREHGEIYRAHFRTRLPTIRVPLRQHDADAALDLQTVLDAVYRNGRYGQMLDYTGEPTPRLEPADAGWADGILRTAGRR
ncbi:MAG TPA: DUF4058 family protein [Gemmataceae bacterium]|jgi:hypothetical protein|nr:DUF4058 family protein [Gemmataceae bacterium]